MFSIPILLYPSFAILSFKFLFFVLVFVFTVPVRAYQIVS